MLLTEHQIFNLYSLGNITTNKDIIEDYVDEISLLHNENREKIKMLFSRFWNVYHLRNDIYTESERKDLDNLLFTLVRVSKPLRYSEEATERLGKSISTIEQHFGVQTRSERINFSVLDFGAGGGNECIAFSKYGFNATYSDFTYFKNIDIVKKRFEIRNLNIPIFDPTLLPETSFDVITCFDVMEHLYDVEFWMANILSRIKLNGLAFFFNGFTSIDYDGDHRDKNVVYSEIFDQLMKEAGFQKILDSVCIQGYTRKSLPDANIKNEEKKIMKRLYKLTFQHCNSSIDSLMSQSNKNSIKQTKLFTISQKFNKDVNDILPLWMTHRLRKYLWKVVSVAPIPPTSNNAAKFGQLADYVTVLRIVGDRLKKMK